MINKKQNKISDGKLKEQLTDEQYNALREKGTELPGTGKYLYEKSTGVYKCAACEQELFSSKDKFDSGTGWPSFDDAIEGAIEEKEDLSHGMRRVEVICSGCGSHIGHKFNDGATDKRVRYCVNSVCLNLKKE